MGARRAYAAGLRARYSRAGMPWRVHDEIVRIDPRVRHLIPHASEPSLYKFVRQTVRPGEVVLDVGAFLGTYAVIEARCAGAGGRVVALEPTAWSASIARRHFRFNQSEAAPMTLVEAAAARVRGRGVLHEYDEPYVNALAEAADIAAKPRLRDVALVTLDGLCAEMDIVPTFIRMDVQGAEVDVLRGAREVIRAAGSGLRIVVEMHPQCWPAFGIDASIVTDTIEALGLQAEPLESGTDLFSRDGHAVLAPCGRASFAGTRAR